MQLEHDYQGSDFSVNVKAVNPSPLDGSGIFLGSYLQSITKNIALGVESVYQTGGMMPGQPTPLPTLIGKFTSDDKKWIATAQVQSQGVLQATYWQRLSDKVEAAAELQLINANGKRDGIATVGAKYDLRMATFRAQLDSTGKVSAMLEQRFAPTFAFVVTGEIDHLKVMKAISSPRAMYSYKLLNVERSESWCRCHDRKFKSNTRRHGHDPTLPTWYWSSILRT